MHFSAVVCFRPRQPPSSSALLFVCDCGAAKHSRTLCSWLYYVGDRRRSRPGFENGAPVLLDPDNGTYQQWRGLRLLVSSWARIPISRP